ncbi:hypothetical protein K402DRAFT_401213 [Aulographum hederae CBS 113979]|uniref:Uncharacterized protein n=1 Tax=Aulographum hederae CBS 113979 TaxID=1176131 RepID=A0A6G1HB28_9PEZI|nr:hypothetical protein K402DRAFT_401213 [Aulographum hederae CBS 113979]
MPSFIIYRPQTLSRSSFQFFRSAHTKLSSPPIKPKSNFPPLSKAPSSPAKSPSPQKQSHYKKLEKLENPPTNPGQTAAPPTPSKSTTSSEIATSKIPGYINPKTLNQIALAPFRRSTATTAKDGAEGKALPPNYKSKFRRVLAIICGLPIVLVFGYELFQRLVLKKERLQRPMPPSAADTS